jgi:hypothetical protein
MEWWQAALWGLAGGVCVELWTLHSLTKQHAFSWRCPIPQGLSAYVTSVVTRVAIGAIVAAAAAAGDEVTGAWVAFGLGVAGPLVVQKLAENVVLADGEEPKSLSPGSRQGRTDASKTPEPVPGSGDGDGDTR